MRARHEPELNVVIKKRSTRAVHRTIFYRIVKQSI
jgi:hypothetical protein